MAFRDFSKSLSTELEKLLANLGDSNVPEQAHRLDNQDGSGSCEDVDISDILKRMKNPDDPDAQD